MTDLREEEDPIVRLVHVGQHLVQHLELAALAELRVAQAEVLNGLKHVEHEGNDFWPKKLQNFEFTPTICCTLQYGTSS